jgi:hypothetical protein
MEDNMSYENVMNRGKDYVPISPVDIQDLMGDAFFSNGTVRELTPEDSLNKLAMQQLMKSSCAGDVETASRLAGYEL